MDDGAEQGKRGNKKPKGRLREPFYRGIKLENKLLNMKYRKDAKIHESI